MNSTNNRQIMVVLCARLVLPSDESECLHHLVHPYKKCHHPVTLNLWHMTSTFELNQDRVMVNQHATYLGQPSKVISFKSYYLGRQTETDTHTRSTTLPTPLNKTHLTALYSDKMALYSDNLGELVPEKCSLTHSISLWALYNILLQSTASSFSCHIRQSLPLSNPYH